MNRKAERLLDAFSTLPAGSIIVEIGCVRVHDELGSEGYSTIHLDAAASRNGWDFHSVDCDSDAAAIAKALTGASVHTADGERWLRGFKGPIAGLYLDGASDPRQALRQYQAAILTNHAVIVIDDVQPIDEILKPTLERGKGDLLLDVLELDGWSVSIHKTEPGYLMAVATR